MIRPDYEKAATKALEVIRDNSIRSTPITPLPVLKKLEGVKVRSLTDFSEKMKQDRDDVRSLFGRNMDAMTFHVDHPNTKYVVVYSQRLPLYILQRGLARELGHIILHHDGKRLPEDVRMEEAMMFAHHFLTPRPIIHAIQESGIALTIERLGSLTGCYERCLKSIRKLPAVHVSPDLNRQIRDQMHDCLDDFIELEKLIDEDDDLTIADLGTYMDGYEE